jgi:hypothetical protein
VNWGIRVRSTSPASSAGPTDLNLSQKRRFPAPLLASSATCFLVSLLVFAVPLPSAGKKKDGMAYGEGLIVNIPLPESEVLQVVGDIAANGIIRGTKEYNKDEFVTGAKAAISSRVFPEWKEGGEVVYKVREEALDPRNFKESGDLGTLVVRYVIKPQGPKNTVLRIDALFQEEIRHTIHLSNGSVESAEYRDIQDHLDFVELMKKQDAEAERDRQEKLARKQNAATQTQTVPAESSSQSYRPSLNTPPTPDTSSPVAPPSAATESPSASTPVVAASSPTQAIPQPVGNPAESAQSPSANTPAPTAVPEPTPQSAPQTVTTSVQPQPPVAAGPSSDTTQADSARLSSTTSSLPPGQSLKQHVEDLRRQVERVVKSPGAPLKSAPFHTAGTLQPLATGTEVLIVISTPYWYGVETHDGQHGWIMRDEVEQKR